MPYVFIPLLLCLPTSSPLAPMAEGSNKLRSDNHTLERLWIQKNTNIPLAFKDHLKNG